MNDMCESKPEEHSDRDYCPHCSTCHVCLEEAETDNEAKVKSLKAEIAHLKQELHNLRIVVNREADFVLRERLIFEDQWIVFCAKRLKKAALPTPPKESE